jgi:hypothetical protein
MSEYFGCDAPCADLLLVDFFCVFFGELAVTLGTDETRADVFSAVIFDGKF